MPGFVAPCLPSKAVRPPSGPLWVHEIKHDDGEAMGDTATAAASARDADGHSG